ncbi:MAG: hypothetical protein Fur0037_16690 [Planctomycetota bacterium]
MCTWLFACGIAAQGEPPAPSGENADGALLARAEEQLDREDPVRALDSFRVLHRLRPESGDAALGLGRTHLMLGQSEVALSYADFCLGLNALDQGAMTLSVNSLIRARRFDEAVSAANAFVARQSSVSAELYAARGSAYFRVQRIEEAATAYRACLRLDPGVAEAHLRLGSGLTAPHRAIITSDLVEAVALAQRGDLAGSERKLRAVLGENPDLSMAHRLLGEVLFRARTERSMALANPSFVYLAEHLPHALVDGLQAARFLSSYQSLSPVRRRVADRALSLFAGRIHKLLANGAHHDLLGELERTTDSEWRKNLRGRRTFDGRVWDDVRGVGGLRAGTGIEALDEAADFGFDTLVHEIAHQVHYYAFDQEERARITELYERARAEGRFLDYYAASNEAEYFAQGVEAFAALAKRPGCETTHGHTRFELYRRDPALHAFIASVVDQDPLADQVRRGALLSAAVDAALAAGRPEDALTGVLWMKDGRYRADRIKQCRVALASTRGL